MLGGGGLGGAGVFFCSGGVACGGYDECGSDDCAADGAAAAGGEYGCGVDAGIIPTIALPTLPPMRVPMLVPMLPAMEVSPAATVDDVVAARAGLQTISARKHITRVPLRKERALIPEFLAANFDEAIQRARGWTLKHCQQTFKIE